MTEFATSPMRRLAQGCQRPSRNWRSPPHRSFALIATLAAYFRVAALRAEGLRRSCARHVQWPSSANAGHPRELDSLEPESGWVGPNRLPSTCSSGEVPETAESSPFRALRVLRIHSRTRTDPKHPPRARARERVRTAHTRACACARRGGARPDARRAGREASVGRKQSRPAVRPPDRCSRLTETRPPAR